MRYFHFILIMLALAAGRGHAQQAGQPAAAQNKPASSQSQPAGGAQDKKPEDDKKPDPAPAKDASMSNYDVNGSSAADAMGTAPP